MNVALIIEHFDPSRGGAQRLAVWIASELSRAGHEVHVVCHDYSSRTNRYRQATLRASHDADASHLAAPPPPPAPPASHDGLHVHLLRGMQLSTPLGLRLFGARARQWVRRHSPDVVHSFTVAFPGDIYHAYSGVYAAMQEQAAHSRPTPTSAVFRRLRQRLPGKQRTLLALERRALFASPPHRFTGARHIIAASPLAAGELRQLSEAINHNLPGPRITEIPTPRLAFDAPPPAADRHHQDPRHWLRAHYRLTDHDRLAIFVGHDFHRLGLRFAIEAIAKTQTRWNLLVVGMGKMREYVELAETLHLGLSPGGENTGRVLFTGPTRELATVYSAADALLLPAFYEPAGASVLDALASGLPVISTKFLAIHDLVESHHAGTIVPSPRDVSLIAGALDRLPLRGSVEERALARRARSAAETHTPAAFMEAILKLYHQVHLEKMRGAAS